jgi:hypothetical protein
VGKNPISEYIVIEEGPSDDVKEHRKTLNRCNYLMEFLRTCLALCALILQGIILLKLFGAI